MKWQYSKRVVLYFILNDVVNNHSRSVKGDLQQLLLPKTKEFILVSRIVLCAFCLVYVLRTQCTFRLYASTI